MERSEGPRLPNQVAEFAIDSIKRYEDLNAPTLEEADEKFRNKLIEVLEKQEVQTPFSGIGGQFLVHRLKSKEGIVVKRLRAARKMHRQGETAPGEYFQLLKTQHEMILKYFGDKFVPHTEFVEVETHFGDWQEEELLEEKEYVMVQEELKGEEGHNYMIFDEEVPEVSEDLKDNLREFVKRYRTMMKEEMAVIEDQFLIDFERDKIMISDTNHPLYFRNHLRDNGFLEYFHIPEGDIKNSSDLLRIICEKIPELRHLKGKDYQGEISEVLHFGDCELYSAIYRKFKERYPDQSREIRWKGRVRGTKNLMAEGFKSLLSAIDTFPPEGDNVFIRKLISKFRLDSQED